jgi:hypothetical protein
MQSQAPWPGPGKREILIEDEFPSGQGDGPRITDKERRRERNRIPWLRCSNGFA